MTLEFETNFMCRNHNFESYSSWFYFGAKPLTAFVWLFCDVIRLFLKLSTNSALSHRLRLYDYVFEFSNWKMTEIVHFVEKVTNQAVYKIYCIYKHIPLTIFSRALPSRTFKKLLSSTRIIQIFLRLLSTGMHAKFMIYSSQIFILNFNHTVGYTRRVL